MAEERDPIKIVMDAHKALINSILNTLENCTVMDFPEVLQAIREDVNRVEKRDDHD